MEKEEREPLLAPSVKQESCSAFRKPRLWGTLAGGLLAGLSSVVAQLSYLIEPVRSSCPHWSPSALVYAQSGSLGGFALASLLIAPYVQRLSPRPFVAAAILISGLCYGIGGLTVIMCNSTGNWLQGVFIVALAVTGVGGVLTILPAYDCLMAWLPNRTGFSAGLVAVGGTWGSIGFSQFNIALERLFDRKILDGGPLFLIIGLIVVGLETVVLCLLNHPRKNKGFSNTIVEQKKVRKISWRAIKMKLLWVLMFIRLFSLIPTFALKSREQNLLTAIWRKPNPPLELLSFLAEILGGVACVLISTTADLVGSVQLWVVILAVQTVTLGFMPWFIATSAEWGRFAALTMYALFGLVKAGPITVLGAMSHEFFGPSLATEALGVLHVPFGLAGLFGPIIMESMYQQLGGFEAFLYLSAAFLCSGFICLALVHYRHHPKPAKAAIENTSTN